METNEPQSDWPSNLDALIAAPEHHKLLLENEHVRVIDAFIPPSEVTKLHTHKWPSCLYIISLSDFIRYDSKGQVLLDSRTLIAPLPSVVWSPPLPPHILSNVGKKDLKVISVELKDIMGV